MQRGQIRILAMCSGGGDKEMYENKIMLKQKAKEAGQIG